MKFHDIFKNLQRHVLPLVQQWSKELEHDFKNTHVKMYSTRTDSDNKYIRSYNKYWYAISIECIEKDDIYHTGYLKLLVYLSQFDDKSEPTVNAVVNLYILDERGEDFYPHRISELFPYGKEPIADKTVLTKLENFLPDLYKSLRRALESNVE